jgi:sugar phosphate isomerase/epimerase
MLNRRSFLAAASALPFANFARAASEAKFKLGLVTYNVAKDWDLPTLLRLCKAAGIAAVECRTTHRHGVEPALSKDERRKVKQQFADAGVLFWGCGSVCEFHSDDPAVVKKNIETCKEFVQLTADLGGKGVKVRPNGVVKGKTVAESCQQIGESLIPCGKAAADVGLEIWVEVHGAVTQQPENMKAIFDACGHKSVGATWNSNASDIKNKSIREGFDLLKTHIRSCHINDLENDASGKYPYRELFKRLKEIDYDRYTLCEVSKPVKAEEGEAFLKKYAALWKELVG